MKITIDKQADAMYIELSDGEFANPKKNQQHLFCG